MSLAAALKTSNVWRTVQYSTVTAHKECDYWFSWIIMTFNGPQCIKVAEERFYSGGGGCNLPPHIVPHRIPILKLSSGEFQHTLLSVTLVYSYRHSLFSPLNIPNPFLRNEHYILYSACPGVVGPNWAVWRTWRQPCEFLRLKPISTIAITSSNTVFCHLIRGYIHSVHYIIILSTLLLLLCCKRESNRSARNGWNFITDDDRLSPWRIAHVHDMTPLRPGIIVNCGDACLSTDCRLVGGG